MPQLDSQKTRLDKSQESAKKQIPWYEVVVTHHYHFADKKYPQTMTM